MPTANVPTGQVQVFHYIQGLRDDLKREVMTHFVKNKETYELSAAKMHARVIFEMPNATPPPPQEAKKPAPRSAKVQFTVPPEGLTYHPNRFQDPAPPLGHQQAPFAADKYLQNAVRSDMYKDYFPRTLAGPYSEERMSSSLSPNFAIY